ncbi:MAG: orotidine-5'-phosphate decarboxylase [Oscillospiraceae bacterium]
MAKDVIIACDFPTRERTLAFLDRFGDERPYVKIGMELFYAEGPDIVREIKARGHNIFLDLKLCDIPNTVKRAMAVLRGTGADMINLHAFGTAEMMTAALEGLTGPDGKRPLLIAVTQLTSTSEERMHRELLIEKPLAEVCLEYAENAMRSGLDGVVCSPLEAGAVHERCGASFLTVTPGVRFAGGDHGDQVRVTTPERAGELGSDYIVVGRPITGAEDPVAAWRRCVNEFMGGARA